MNEQTSDVFVPDQRHRRPSALFNFVSAVSLCLIVASIVLSTAFRWRGIWPSVFLDVGVTTLLGVVLYVLQDRFIVEVRDSVATVQETQRATSSLAHGLQKRVEEQAFDLATLQRAVDSLRTSRSVEEEATIGAVSTEITARSVIEAMDLAERLKALDDRFRIRVATDLAGLRLAVSRGVSGTGGMPSETIELKLWFPHKWINFTAVWAEGRSLDQVVIELQDALNRENLDASPETLDAERFVRELSHSLELAVNSRRGSHGHRLQGPLLEVFNERWVLTEAGIESAQGGVVDVRFPTLSPFFEHRDWSPPPCPKGVDEREWDALMDVGRVTYGAPHRKGY